MSQSALNSELKIWKISPIIVCHFWGKCKCYHFHAVFDILWKTGWASGRAPTHTHDGKRLNDSLLSNIRVLPMPARHIDVKLYMMILDGVNKFF